MPGPTGMTPPEIILTSLHTGDVVEVHHRNGQLIYHGEVETVDLSQRVLWILHGALKERKLIDASEYQVRPCPPAGHAVSPST
jgi:hypothetical protein